MGYDCSCTGSSFDMKAENIGEALKALAKTDYVSQPEEILAICEKGSFEEKKDMFQAVFQDNGYFAGFDEQGNVCEICHETYKWRKDNDFFDVFARFVERGSYIEMAGEDGQLWRMVFDGEHCREVYPTLLWPEECAPAYQLAEAEREAADLTKNNPELAEAIFTKMKRAHLREDVVSQIDGNPDVPNFSDSDIDAIVDGVEHTLKNNEAYYDAYWLSVDMAIDDVVFRQGPEDKSLLADQIAAAEAQKQEPVGERAVRQEQSL